MGEMRAGERPGYEFVVGEDGLPRWPEPCGGAWGGLLRIHRRLTRRLEADLEEEHGLSLSALELLGRLAARPDRRCRLSVLADESGLSLSRVSRVVDSLESRGLVARRRCTSDARAIDAELTAAGLETTCAARASHFAAVQKRFFDRLEPAEVELLARLFDRIGGAGDPAGAPAGDHD